MKRERFFNKKKEFLTLEEVIEKTNSNISQNYDLTTKIFDISTLESAKNNEISFINSGQYLDQFYKSEAGFCFSQKKYLGKEPKSMILIENDDPYFAYSQIVSEFYEEKKQNYSNKNIDPSAKIGNNCQIACNAFIGKNVEIGDNCIIGPNSSIMQDCKIGNGVIINCNVVVSFAIIGNNCIIHHGVKIGQDGFGFAHNNGINHKIIQIGIVEIGDDVEIGANTCIDRGAIENTVIGNNVKIDNLNQIAHNVKIGQGTVIAGCCAIAGSAEIGKFVQIGGRAGIGGHIKIGDGAKIAGMSGVMRDIEPMQVVGGAPALPIRKWHKLNAQLFKLAEK